MCSMVLESCTSVVARCYLAFGGDIIITAPRVRALVRRHFWCQCSWFFLGMKQLFFLGEKSNDFCFPFERKMGDGKLLECPCQWVCPGAATYNNPPTFWAAVVCSGAGSGAPWWPLLAILAPNALTDIVGWFWAVTYVWLHGVLYQAIDDTLQAYCQRWSHWRRIASMPNWSFCCIVQAAT